MSVEPLTLGIIGCGLLILLCVLGVRIAYAAAIIGAFGLAMLTGFGPGLRTAGVVPHASVVNYTLSVLPMFILIGYLAYYAGITQSAFEAARRWFGWLPGGLATGTVFARMLRWRMTTPFGSAVAPEVKTICAMSSRSIAIDGIGPSAAQSRSENFQNLRA